MNLLPPWVERTVYLVCYGLVAFGMGQKWQTFRIADRLRRRPRLRLLARYRHWKAERAALPDGTRVRLVCQCTGCGHEGHQGVWTTSWTPRRMGELVDDIVDDYKLTREGDGQETYAVRDVLEVVP